MILEEFPDHSIDLRTGLKNPISFWFNRLGHYDPEIVLRPENRKEAIQALCRIDSSGSLQVVASFVVASLEKLHKGKYSGADVDPLVWPDDYESTRDQQS